MHKHFYEVDFVNNGHLGSNLSSCGGFDLGLVFFNFVSNAFGPIVSDAPAGDINASFKHS